MTSVFPAAAAFAATTIASPCLTWPVGWLVIMTVGATLVTVTFSVTGADSWPLSSVPSSVTTYEPPSSGWSVNVLPVPVAKATLFFFTVHEKAVAARALPARVMPALKVSDWFSAIVRVALLDVAVVTPATTLLMTAIGSAGLTVTVKSLTSCWPSLSVTVTSTL